MQEHASSAGLGPCLAGRGIGKGIHDVVCREGVFQRRDRLDTQLMLCPPYPPVRAKLLWFHLSSTARVQLSISRSVCLHGLQKITEATGTKVRLALENAPQIGTWSCKTQEHSKSPLYVSLHRAQSLAEK